MEITPSLLSVCARTANFKEFAPLVVYTVSRIHTYTPGHGEHCTCVAAITHQPLHSPELAINLLGTPPPEDLFTLSCIKLRQGQYKTDQDAFRFPRLSPARLSPSFAPRRTAFVPHPFSSTLFYPNTHARPPSIYPLPQAYAS